MVVTIRLMCKLMTSVIESMEELSFAFANDKNLSIRIRIGEQRHKLLAVRVALQEIADDLRSDH